MNQRRRGVRVLPQVALQSLRFSVETAFGPGAVV
uniref:Uncharacterized protein n=1 Tax=Anguilla anguilla TaxID=7936 RepID=A0A0E9US52_ANGAN